MNVTTNLMIAGVVVVGGRWAEGKAMDVKVGVGIGVVLIMSSIGANYMPELVEPLSLLVLVSALLIYGLPLFKGLTGQK